MKLFVVAVLPLLLSGCGVITDALAPPYDPVPIRIFSQAQYDADVVECRVAGAAFQPHFSIGSAVATTVQGATANSSLIPISPLVPLAGAAGGAARAASDGLDLASRQHANVFRNCLRDETRRDGSAIVADPRD